MTRTLLPLVECRPPEQLAKKRRFLANFPAPREHSFSYAGDDTQKTGHAYPPPEQYTPPVDVMFYLATKRRKYDSRLTPCAQINVSIYDAMAFRSASISSLRRNGFARVPMKPASR